MADRKQLQSDENDDYMWTQTALSSRGVKRGNWEPSRCSEKMYKFWQVIKRAEVSAVRVTGERG